MTDENRAVYNASRLASITTAKQSNIYSVKSAIYFFWEYYFYNLSWSVKSILTKTQIFENLTKVLSLMKKEAQEMLSLFSSG